jgi:hypothetical protein
MSVCLYPSSVWSKPGTVYNTERQEYKPQCNLFNAQPFKIGKLKSKTRFMKRVFIKPNGKKLKRKQAKRAWILFLAKLGFKDMTVADKVDKAKKIVGAMTGNPNFLSPVPALATVAAAANKLNAAQIAIDGSKLKTMERNLAEAELDVLISALQGYVNAASMKDREKILSAGFDVRGNNIKPGILPAPENLRVKSTQIIGQLDLRWKAVKKKNIYRIEIAINAPELIWETKGESTKASITIDNLVAGQKYWCRVCVINSAGASGWSNRIPGRPTQD